MGRWPVETQSGFVGGGAEFTSVWWLERGWGGATLSARRGLAALDLLVKGLSAEGCDGGVALEEEQHASLDVHMDANKGACGLSLGVWPPPP